MPLVIIACCLLMILTTALHYEVLGGLNVGLPLLTIPNHTKLLVVIIAAFFAHATEVVLYGVTLYALNWYLGGHSLSGGTGFHLSTFLFFSAETYTSMGFGDLTPVGPIRLLAGAEALNGLLLIGWSTSFTYISMEKFWNGRASANDGLDLASSAMAGTDPSTVRRAPPILGLRPRRLVPWPYRHCRSAAWLAGTARRGGASPDGSAAPSRQIGQIR